MKKKLIFCFVLAVLSPLLAHYIDIGVGWALTQLDVMIFRLMGIPVMGVGSSWLYAPTSHSWVLVINFCLLFYLLEALFKTYKGREKEGA
ncbi:MAG: hypothetical protein Q4C55_08740 [Eubacterium sp.]|nr:hypothetical protein [Eubacterium sp.]